MNLLLLDGLSDFIEALAIKITMDTATVLIITGIIAVALLTRLDK